MSGHVFISHGSEDRDEANKLCAFVEGRGVKAWIAPRDVRPGMDYSEQLQLAIEECLAFVVLVTDKANKSPYVRAETEMAFSTGKPIFPVRKSDIKPAAGLAFFLKIRHWTDAFGKDEGAAMERLAQELQALAGMPPEPAVPAPPAEPVPPPPPPAPPPPPPPPPVSEKEELLAAAIGPNADYFLRRWAGMDAKGKSYDWNWAACFLNFCWFGYRKMWLAALVIGLFYVVTTPLTDPTNKTLFRVIAFLVVALSFITGAFGNKLYRTQIERLVAKTAGMGREEAIQHLRRQGGTSVPGLIGQIMGILLLGMVASLVVARQSGAGVAPVAPTAPTGPSATGDKPVDAGGQAVAAPPAAAPAATFDASYFVGRWSDEADCANPVEFFADGRWVTETGGGVWSFEGNQMTLSGPGGSQVVNIAALDNDSFSLTTNEGQTSVSRRC